MRNEINETIPLKRNKEIITILVMSVQMFYIEGLRKGDV
jgi:hypothetical protein